MNAVSTLTALIPASTTVQVPDLTPGVAWSCVSDLSSPGVYVSGNQAIGEAVARRLQTPRGGLLDDPTYGYDLSAFVDADVSPQDLAMMTANIQTECMKDERVAAVTASVVLNSGGVLIVSIALTPVEGIAFTLVLSVSAVAANPLQILSTNR